MKGRGGERVRWLRMKLGRLLRRGKQEAAMEAELQFHFDQLVAQFREQGLSERDALYAAKREFGSAGAYREEMRDAWRPPELADLWRSVRFALRSLSRSRGFTALSVLTLALGIGANTAMYSTMSTIQFTPLPYPRSEELDQIDRSTAQMRRGRFSAADYLDLRRESSGYGQVAAWARGDVSLAQPDEPAEFAAAVRVSANFFELLGIEPQLGRGFQAQEEVPGRHRLVVLSQRAWKQRFAGAPDVVGRTVRVNGEPHEVVGVLPASFNDWRHLGWVDVFRPLALTDAEAADRKTLLLSLIGRRSRELSAADAQGYFAAFGERLAAEHPAFNAGAAWRALPLEQVKSGAEAKLAFWMLIGLSGVVLLIACSNLANLLLARTIARTREFAVRAALGASRKQLLHPLIVESLLLALAGGLCALFVARWVADWLTAASTGDNGENVAIVMDWTSMVWAFAASLVTAVGFGIAPGLFAMRIDVHESLKSGLRGTTGGLGHRRFQSLLIVGQFALAMTLLAGAALFIRGLDELNNRREGWESDQLVVGTILLPAGKYAQPEDIAAFQRDALQRLEALPGATSASISYSLPFFGLSDPRRYVVEGQAAPPGQEPEAVVNGVSPRYFETVGTRVLAGRAFTEKDALGAPRVYVVNEAMAQTLFPGESALGRRIARADSGSLDWGEIVGVVADVRSIYAEPSPIPFQLYQPMAQEPRPYNEIAVRTAGTAPASLVDEIRLLVTELDPDLPVRKLQPADERIHRANYQMGVFASMLSGFALVGLALASLGIYGVVTRTTAQRTSEFGIRIALGACLADITRLVLGSGVKLALAGSAVGLLGAVGISRLFASVWPGMRLSSPPVIAAVTLLLVGIALLASYLPARRAARINPLAALRAE